MDYDRLARLGAQHFHIDPNLILLRKSANVVYGNDEHVLRIDVRTRPDLTYLEICQRLSQFMPVVAPASHVFIENRLLTLWPRYEGEPAVDYEWLGSMASIIHNATDSMRDLKLPNWLHESAAKNQRRLHSMDRDRDQRLLQSKFDQIAIRLINKPLTLIHGDLHWGNVVAGPRLIDFDQAAWGPPSVDWAPAANAEHVFGEAKALQLFQRGYGRDEYDEAMAQWKLLSATLWLAASLPQNPRWQDEYHRRMRWWRGSNERWRGL